MRRLLLAALLLAAVASPAAAAVRSCNQALVDGGLCRAQTDVLVAYSIPAAHQADFLAAWSDRLGYQTEIPCTSARKVDEHGILFEAGPGDGTCTAELAGNDIPNPQTRRQAVDAFLRAELRRTVVEYRRRLAEEAARTATEAEPSPEIQ